MHEGRWSRSGVLRLCGHAVLLAWFAWFARPALFNGFNSDDPMNVHKYFRVGWPEMLRNVALFFEPSYRPVGGVLYKAMYDLFGFDPLPVHIAVTAVLLLNVFLMRRFAELATGSEWAGFLAALIAVYHTRLAHLYYLPSFLYDVLCFAFYVSALNVYVGARSRGLPVAGKRLLAVLALYALALGSKEMAITFPVALLLYESIVRRPVRWRALVPGCVAGGMTLAFIAGKAMAPDALVRAPGYFPVLDAAHIMAENAKYLNEILYIDYHRPFFTPVLTTLLWLTLLGAAVWLRHRPLGWASAMAIVAPLPVAVLPGRGGACLYIPLAFWSAIAVVLLQSACDRAARIVPDRFRNGFARTLAAAAVAALLAMVEYENREMGRIMAAPTLQGSHIAAEVRRVIPHPRPGCRALYLNDLSPGWETAIITELVWGDRGAEVWLQHQSHLAQPEIDRMDYLLEFAPDRALRVVRGPAEPVRGRF